MIMDIKYIIGLYISLLLLMNAVIINDYDTREWLKNYIISYNICIYEKICLKNDSIYAFVIILFYISIIIFYLTIGVALYYIILVSVIAFYGFGGFLFTLYSMYILLLKFIAWFIKACKKNALSIIEPPIFPKIISELHETFQNYRLPESSKDVDEKIK